MEHIKRLDATVASMVNGTSGMFFLLSGTLRGITTPNVAVYITYVAHDGDRDEFQMSIGTPLSASYSWGDKMATTSIVGEEVTFTLAIASRLHPEGFFSSNSST